MSAALHDGRETQQYKYDSAGRLIAYVRGDNPFDDRCVPIGECAPGAEKARRWWLDGVGNWKQTEQRDSFNSDSFDTRGVTSFNEYTVAAGATLDYDDNGNLMNDEKNLHYHWDAFNRLRRVTDANDATTATYTYDTDGRRLMKDLAGTANDVSFAYDGWQIILEYAGAAGLPLRQYTYGAFINEPLFMDVADGNGEFLDEGDSSPLERYSYLQTPIYNVAALVDYDTQELVERYDYDPYGKYTLVVGDTRTELGESLVGNSMTFTGHWFDRETGMYWMRKRYYSVIGYFVGRDPISSSNLYNYCANNTISNYDPNGERWVSADIRYEFPDLKSQVLFDESLGGVNPDAIFYDYVSWKFFYNYYPNIDLAYSYKSNIVEKTILASLFLKARLLAYGTSYSWSKSKYVARDRRWGEGDEEQNRVENGIAYGSCEFLTNQLAMSLTNAQDLSLMQEGSDSKNQSFLVDIAKIHKWAGVLPSGDVKKGIRDHWSVVFLEPKRIEADIVNCKIKKLHVYYETDPIKAKHRKFIVSDPTKRIQSENVQDFVGRDWPPYFGSFASPFHGVDILPNRNEMQW